MKFFQDPVDRFIARLSIALLILTIIVVCLSSCATPKTITDNKTDITTSTSTDSLSGGSLSLVEGHNDTKVEQSQQTDSTSSEHTNIVADLTFVPSGGTFNPTTGEITGIQNAKLQADINKLNHTIRSQDTRIHILQDSLTMAMDSLAHYKNLSSQEKHEEIHAEQDAPSKPFGWRFCVGCTILFWIIVTAFAVRLGIKIYTHGAV